MATRAAQFRKIAKVARKQRMMVIKTHEPRLAGQLRQYFRNLSKRLPGIKAGNVVPLFKEAAFDLDEPFWDAEERTLSRVVKPFYADLAGTAYDNTKAQLGVALDLNSRGLSGVMDRVGQRITNITGESRDRVAAAVQDGIERGLSIPDLSAELEDMVAGWGRPPQGSVGARADVIARTETGNAYNWASAAAYRESGIVEVVECFDADDCGWDGHDDPEPANGRICTLDEMEEVPLSHPNCVRAFGPAHLEENAAAPEEPTVSEELTSAEVVPSDLPTAAERWLNYSGMEQIRASIAQGAPTPEAAAIQSAVRSAVPDAPALFRGMASAEPDQFAALIAEGGQFDIPLSSFSAEEGVARDFAGTNPQQTHLIVEMERGSRSWYASQHMSYKGGREWISSGRFEVLSVTQEAAATPEYGPGAQGTYRVVVRQIAP